jgi:hypothetical protein
MGENTFRYQPDSKAGTYWRRRFGVLSIGLAVLALISWALSSALSATSAGRPAVTGNGQPGHGPAPVAGGSASPTAPGRQAGGTAGRHGSAGGSAPATGPRAGPTSSPRPSPSGKASYPGIRPAFCARRDIVLSLSGSQASFGPRQAPAFSLTIVSTQPAECSFNVGPRYLALVIKEGPVRVWSSADCVRRSGSLVSALKRGVPTVLPVTWDRRTSSPGCSGTVTRVPAGVYTAYATQGTVASAPMTFRLG